MKMALVAQQRETIAFIARRFGEETHQTNKELAIKMANSSPFLYYKACFGR